MSTIPVEKLTKAYLRIKGERSQLKAEFDAADGKLRKQQDTIKAALLDHLKEHNVESVRTSEGLFYRTTRTRYWTSDWSSMHKFIMEMGVPEFFEKRLNQSVVKQFVEENPDIVPPGLNVDSEYMVSVRKK